MFANAPEDEWDLTMCVHLKGLLTTARHAAGQRVRRGSAPARSSDAPCAFTRARRVGTGEV